MVYFSKLVTRGQYTPTVCHTISRVSSNSKFNLGLSG